MSQHPQAPTVPPNQFQNAPGTHPYPPGTIFRSDVTDRVNYVVLRTKAVDGGYKYVYRVEHIGTSSNLDPVKTQSEIDDDLDSGWSLYADPRDSEIQ